MRPIPYRLCDVFTARPFTGNALAVFTDAQLLEDATMQALAREMNLSECTFVLPPTARGADAKIRIFTPTTELPFAGHPTLGTAFVLTHPLERGSKIIQLETGRGVSTVRLSRVGTSAPFGWMTQPLPVIESFAQTDELLRALHLERSLLPIELYDNGAHHAIIEVETPEKVAALRPDLGRLAELGRLAVTVCAGSGTRWKSRVFAPGEGIAEDPATGGAAGPLALHLTRHDRIRFGDELVVDQGAELGRPSTLHARLLGSDLKLEGIEVGGNAVVIGGGEIDLQSA